MYQAIVFLPLIGCVIAGLFGRAIGPRPSELVTTTLLFASMVLSWIAFAWVGFGHQDAHVVLGTFIGSGELHAEWALRIDPLTAVMLVVVTTVSAFVHLYSIGYMQGDPGRPRFFSYLSLFTFAMLMLVTADNLVQLFFGWEGVGLMSYLLIGFWYQKPSANAAAIKAFVVNRVGDFGFALGIFAIFMLIGSTDLETIFAGAPGLTGKTIDFFGWHADALTLTCLLLFMGAMGQSAQFLLHTWLPDAMEGPTPVSALIHAATMVTAGVFMVARLSPLFELAPNAQAVVMFFGATTAFFAATVGLVQNDIKRIVAYSTCSQLGYMFVAPDLQDLSRRAARPGTLRGRARKPAVDAHSDRHSRRRIDPRWLPVQGTVRGSWRGRILPRVGEDEPAHHRGHAPHPRDDCVPADGHDGVGFCGVLRFLYPAALFARGTRPPAPIALPVPAQQMVLRRALRSDLRAPCEAVRTVPVEGRRRLHHRRLRPRWGVGTGA